MTIRNFLKSDESVNEVREGLTTVDSGVWDRCVSSPPIDKTYKALVTDFDGVLAAANDVEVLKHSIKLIIEKVIGEGVPLAIVTGKAKDRVMEQIVNPFKDAIRKAGIKVNLLQFAVYANNGSTVYELSKDRFDDATKYLTAEQRVVIEQLPTIKFLNSLMGKMKNFVVKNGGTRAAADIEKILGNYFLHETLKDEFTVFTECFVLDPKTFPSWPVELKNELEEYFGKDFTLFDVSLQLWNEMNALEVEKKNIMNGVLISSSERSVDFNGRGTGKRNALIDFTEVGHDIKPEDALRFGDNPLGLDSGLLWAFPGETETGYSNLNYDTMAAGNFSGLMGKMYGSAAHFENYIRCAPKVISSKAGKDQYRRVWSFIEQAKFVGRR